MRAQNEAFPRAAALLGFEPVFQRDRRDNGDHGDKQPVVAHDFAGLHDHLREQRELGVEALEDRLKTRASAVRLS